MGGGRVSATSTQLLMQVRRGRRRGRGGREEQEGALAGLTVPKLYL